MKLSTRSRYGLRMLLDIALNNGSGPVRIDDISKRRGLSVKYLEKLIRPLKKAGYVRSKRGPKGGYTLTSEPTNITVGEIVRLLEGDLTLTECVNDPSVCSISSECVTRKVWADVTESMLCKLDAITLDDLVNQAKQCDMLGLPCC